MTWEETGRLAGLALRLESDQLISVARQVWGETSETPTEFDRDLDVLYAALDRHGVAYPGHMLAVNYRLSPTGYALLLISLLPFHAPELFAELTELLGAPAEPQPRLNHAIAVFAPERLDDPSFRTEIASWNVVTEGLVKLRGEGDPILSPSLAVLELMGFADPD